MRAHNAVYFSFCQAFVYFLFFLAGTAAGEKSYYYFFRLQEFFKRGKMLLNKYFGGSQKSNLLFIPGTTGNRYRGNDRFTGGDIALQHAVPGRICFKVRND